MSVRDQRTVCLWRQEVVGNLLCYLLMNRHWCYMRCHTHSVGSVFSLFLFHYNRTSPNLAQTNSNTKNCISCIHIIGHSGTCFLAVLSVMRAIAYRAKQLLLCSKVLLHTRMPQCPIVWHNAQSSTHICLPVCCFSR